jgi:hypothetical protein
MYNWVTVMEDEEFMNYCNNLNSLQFNEKLDYIFEITREFPGESHQRKINGNIYYFGIDIKSQEEVIIAYNWYLKRFEINYSQVCVA